MSVARHTQSRRAQTPLRTGAPLRWAPIAGAAALGGHSGVEQKAADVQWAPAPTPVSAVTA